MVGLRGYDAWVTREPDYGPEAPYPGDDNWPRCSNCGCWLKLEPTGHEVKAAEEHCDGKIVWTTDVYTSADKGILDIIGWEFLGKATNASYPPPCGMNDQEHEPHDFVVHAWDEYHRTCTHCGFDNLEVQ